jgi:hypothetical protein
MYCRVLNGLNLKFGRKPVDACAFCTKMGLQLAQARAGSSARRALEAEKHAHLQDADAGFRMRAHDQELARRSASANSTVPPGPRAEDGVEYLETDMQAVLGAPSLHVGESYYMRHLRVSNYGVFSGQENTGYMHFWDEVTAKKGPDNCLSVVLHHLWTQGTGASSLCWWADNYPGTSICANVCVCVCVFFHVCLGVWVCFCMCVWVSLTGQVKNMATLCFCDHLVQEESPFHLFDRVDLKFSPPGHTFMMLDRLFGVVKQRARRRQVPRLTTLIERTSIMHAVLTLSGCPIL